MDGVPPRRSIRDLKLCLHEGMLCQEHYDSAGLERVSVESPLQFFFTFCKRKVGSHFGVPDCIISEYNGLTSLSRLKTCNEPAFFVRCTCSQRGAGYG